MYRRTMHPRNAASGAEFYDKIRPGVTIRLSAYGVPQSGLELSGLHNAVRRPGA
jgi:hypothetical protein